MSYNRKAIVDALSKMNKAKKPKQVNDIIMDPEGQNKFPGLPTRIPSDSITMETTPYPVLGVDNFGNQQMMYPGANYIFPGADYVDEYPMMQKGGQRSTLYVDPNDPAGRARYQAYQDSLYNYNYAIEEMSKDYPFFDDQKERDSYFKVYLELPEVQSYDITNPNTIKSDKFLNKNSLQKPDYIIDRRRTRELDRNDPDYRKDEKSIEYLGYSHPKTEVIIAYNPETEIIAKQQQLINAGYDIGKADGIWGPKSQAAWEEFQKTQTTEPEAIQQPTPEQAPTLEVAPLDNTPQQPIQTNQPQVTPAPQIPSGYNVWTDNLGQPLDPQIYGYAPSNNPRQISQHADTYALKRANEAYNKLGATPWATTGNKLVTDLYKPYFSKQAATNALEQTAQQLGVETSQLQIVKAPAGYSGYVIIQTLPQQRYGGIFQSGGATDWRTRIASTLNYQKGGQLSKEEFEKRKAAYKKMTGRDFEPPKSFKQSPQAREYYQNKYNQQPVIQSQPSETVQQSTGMSADEAEQLKIQNTPSDPRINQFSFEKDNRDPYTQKRDQYYAEQITDPTGWNKVGHYIDAATFIGGNLGNTIFGGDDWKNSLQNFEAFQLNPYNSKKDKLLNRADMVLSNVGNAFIDIGTAELGFVIPQLYKASFKKLLEIGSKANQRADVLQGVQGALDLFQGDASAIGDILLNVASYRSKMDNFDASTVYHNLNNWNKITKAEKIDTAKDIFNLFNAVYQQSQRTDPMQPYPLYQQGGLASQFLERAKQAQQRDPKKFAEETRKLQMQKFREDMTAANMPKSMAEAEAMIQSGQLKIETIAQQQAREKREAELRKKEREAALEAYEKRVNTPGYNAWTGLPGESWRDMLAAEAAPLAATFRFSQGDNFIDDYINPAVWIGSMAQNLGESPQQAKETGSLLPYITSVGTPLLGGAMAGIGAKNTGQFVNNIVNPFAGMNPLKSKQLPGSPNNFNLEELRRVYHNSERFLQPAESRFLHKHGHGLRENYRTDMSNYGGWGTDQWDATVHNTFDLNKLRKPVNKSGLTKEDALSKASAKDKEIIAKMSNTEFENTVLKPNGEIAIYKPGTDVEQMTYDLGNRKLKLKDAKEMSEKEYVNVFNKNLDLLNNIIAKRNKSGIDYKVKELTPDGRLIFSTPEQKIPIKLSTKQKTDIEFFNKNPEEFLKNRTGLKKEGTKWKMSDEVGGYVFNSIEEAIDFVKKEMKAFTEPKIISGESVWGIKINPGQWKGAVEDITNTEYLRSIPGLEMSNTTSGVFADHVARRGTGAYESINEYLKKLDLGRVKPGFNSQTKFSKGAWENFIKSGKGVGFYNDPNTVYGAMKSLFPYIGAGALGAASQFQQGGTTEEELTPAQLAMMKARLAYAHMHGNPSAQRMVAPVDNPYIFTGNEPYASPDTAGYSGTHYMFSQGPFAVPTIQTGPDGQLYYNVNASPNDSEAMQFDSPEDAEVFARYYKTVAPAFQDMELTDEEIEEYKRGGCTIVKL